LFCDAPKREVVNRSPAAVSVPNRALINPANADNATVSFLQPPGLPPEFGTGHHFHWGTRSFINATRFFF
jgi:hypothetical protein